MALFIGVVGFVLFFLYDWNRVFKKTGWMSHFFLAGCLCQVAAGALLLREAWIGRESGMIIWLVFAVIFLAGLIYTLFFALPFDSTYRREADRNKACRSGMYGWCRHPGIWWFFACFFCLGMACRSRAGLTSGIGLSIFNMAYAWYQDKWIFPEEFSDYRDYQREVPFLLPGWRKKG